MAKYTWVGKVYSDWFREALSPLERTWRFPILFSKAQKFLKREVFLKAPDNYCFFKNGYLFIRTDWVRLLLQPGLLFAIPKIILETASAKKYWQEKISTQHEALLDSWEKVNLTKKTNKELWQFVNKTARHELSFSIWTTYLGLYSFGFEIMLALFYRFFVNDKPEEYQKLLIGFSNKTTDLNLALFNLGQLKKQGKENKYKEDFKKLLKDYGFRISDWDLVLPILREDKELLAHLIQLYANSPELDPSKKLRQAKKQRGEKVKFTINNLRLKPLTKPVFNWILKWAWEYVPLRETRQHYSASSNYFLRKALNLIGKRFNLKENMIFYLEKEELEKLLNGHLKIQKAKSLVEERFKLREKQKLNLPNYD